MKIVLSLQSFSWKGLGRALGALRLRYENLWSRPLKCISNRPPLSPAICMADNFHFKIHLSKAQVRHLFLLPLSKSFWVLLTDVKINYGFLQWHWRSPRILPTLLLLPGSSISCTHPLLSAQMNLGPPYCAFASVISSAQNPPVIIKLFLNLWFSPLAAKWESHEGLFKKILIPKPLLLETLI